MDCKKAIKTALGDVGYGLERVVVVKYFTLKICGQIIIDKVTDSVILFFSVVTFLNSGCLRQAGTEKCAGMTTDILQLL